MTILAIVHLSVNRLDLVFRWSLGQEASLLNKNLGPKNFTSRPRLSCWLSASSLDWKRNPLPHYDTPTSSCTHRHMHTHKRTHAHTHTHSSPILSSPLHLDARKAGYLQDQRQIQQWLSYLGSSLSVLPITRGLIVEGKFSRQMTRLGRLIYSLERRFLHKIENPDTP